LICQDILSWADITIFGIPGLELELKDGRRLAFSSEDAVEINLVMKTKAKALSKQMNGMSMSPRAAALSELEEWMAYSGRTETHLVERLGAAFDSMGCPQEDWVETLVAMTTAEVDELTASLVSHLHIKEAPVAKFRSVGKLLMKPKPAASPGNEPEPPALLQVVKAASAVDKLSSKYVESKSLSADSKSLSDEDEDEDVDVDEDEDGDVDVDVDVVAGEEAEASGTLADSQGAEATDPDDVGADPTLERMQLFYAPSGRAMLCTDGMVFGRGSLGVAAGDLSVSRRHIQVPHDDDHHSQCLS
jgi:hypothetical protein